MSNFLYLTILHIFNDGLEGSFLLLLPFIAKDLHINLTQVGILGTVEGLMETLFALPSVYLAAKFGGIRVLLAALLIYSLGFVFTGVSSIFLLLIITFVLGGIGFGSFHSIAFGLLSRWTDREKRGKTLGNFTATGDLGKVILSSILTFIIVAIGWRYTTFIYGAVGLALFLIFLKKGMEINQSISESEKPVKNIPLIHFFKNPVFVFANITNFMDTLASNSLFIFLPFLLLKREISPALLGFFTGIYFLGNFLGKSLLGRLVDKHGNTKVFILSELIMGIFIFILANTPSIFLIFVSSIILGMFTRGTVPVNKTMVSESVEHHENFEKAFGINIIIASSSAAIAPLLLGFISNNFGVIAAFNTSAFIALAAIIPAVLFAYTKKHNLHLK